MTRAILSLHAIAFAAAPSAPAAAALRITENTTWSVLESPHLFTEEVVVASGATLTVEAGAEIRFGRTDPLDRGEVPGPHLRVEGLLEVLGEEGSPVRFSGLDDTNDDWGGIVFAPEAISAELTESGEYFGGSILRHAEIRDAGDTGLFLDGSAPFIASIVFAANAALYDKGEEIVVDPAIQDDELIHGGALYAYRLESELRVVDCTFADNYSANVGGAASAVECDPTPVAFERCSFERNTSGARGGGALRLLGSSPKLDDCAFLDNTAERGGAIHASYYSNARIENSLFRDNQVDLVGGALFIAHQSDVLIIGCRFESNSVASESSMGGGAIGIHANGAPVIHQSVIENNVAPRGAALLLTHREIPHERPVYVLCSRFTGNLATTPNGAPTIHSSDWQDLVLRANSIEDESPTAGEIVFSAGEWPGNSGADADVRGNFWLAGSSIDSVELRDNGGGLPGVILGRDRIDGAACVK
ncbi:MAG: hypothetical protein CME06_05375 [Gemmatimonadetes bacterium]|nr:hypothetical protein [Gemmatimonadota bacterium]